MLGKNVQKFCGEDISLIENYEKAVNDKTQTWDCHHHLEISLGLSVNELKEQGKYFNVPASELIFLTHSDHMKLHNHGEKNPMHGKNAEDYMSEEAIKEKRKKQSKKMKGEKNGMFGRNHTKETKKIQSEKHKGENSAMYGTHPTWMNNGTIRVFPKTQEEIEHYLERCYVFGYKLK